uniref:SUI1 domain-containing protein n=1 Tax=viral metagenome TaxID=1070528 RepID=A0A6C0KG42_9ZZZZ
MNSIDFDEKKDSFNVHISIQQRNAKKNITIVSGFPDTYDLPKILKYIKKIYKCGGSLVKDKTENTVIQVSGDQRQNIRAFFIECDVVDEPNIILHGF